MKYWWVNHKQTARQEIAGAYLWSPKQEANGTRSQFYENMRLAAPGDPVLSFANGQIRNVGVVQDFAVPALKPTGFGSTGENWSADGWLLPVNWRPLHSAVRPKDIIYDLGPLLPAKYSPIQPANGNGNQKAYLAEVGKPAFDLVIERGGLDEMPATDVEPEVPALTRADDEQQKAIEQDPGLDTTTKQQVVLARHGQGLFRKRVLELEPVCRLTKIKNPDLLVASHIKPWRACATAGERLNGANGLALAPHVDRLFDRGLISFEIDGKVLVSPQLRSVDLDRLGLTDFCERGCGPFLGIQAPFLQYHRESVYRRPT
ncbi:HNH endonuclease [Bradyrhizobium liaoningense]|uniref:HNH endonuclease n=1 Tax=Bradyrhizobium liaoningense TaxID=43992 RepID=UPI001BA9379C|nr:HNH endonuclease [Bradyrhizobium liaoningense]MBR1029399.1 HNH endonuclease [Bradyrhizobium liaoningense]